MDQLRDNTEERYKAAALEFVESEYPISINSILTKHNCSCAKTLKKYIEDQTYVRQVDEIEKFRNAKKTIL